MKTVPRSMTAALLAVTTLTTACIEDVSTPLDPNDVRFTAGIAGNAKAVTRAADATWGPSDQIGIFMVRNGSTTVVNETSNRLYTVSSISEGTATFTADADNEIHFPADGTVDFISYYPYVGGAELDDHIAVTIGTQTNQPSFDLLYAKTTTGYTKATNTVALQFDHQLTKIVMSTVAGDGVSGGDLSGMTVTIAGTNTANTFNLASGSLGTSTTPADVIARELTDADAVVYDAIIMPGNYAVGTVSVTFDIDDEEFTWKVGAIDFQPKKQHNDEVKLSRTGVTVTGTITPWEVVTEIHVNAN
jgi:hypothetical protein